MLELVTYTNQEGMKEIRRVPQDSSPLDYHTGILVGPPDFSGLQLEQKIILILNNALVDAGLVSYPDLNGKRAQLLRIVQELPGVDAAQATSLRFELLGLYQRDWYPELFEG